MPISGNVRQGSPNPILRPAPRRQRPDHRPTAAARAVRGGARGAARWLHDRSSSSSSTSRPAATPTTPDAAALMRVAAGAADELRAYVDGDAGRGARDLAVALRAGRRGRPAARRRTQIRARGRAEAAEPLEPASTLAGADARGARERRPSTPARAVRPSVPTWPRARASCVADDGVGLRSRERRPRSDRGLRAQRRRPHGPPSAGARDARVASRRRHPRHPAASTPRSTPPRSMSVMKIRVLLVEDFPLVREGVATRCTRDPGIAVVGEAAERRARGCSWRRAAARRGPARPAHARAAAA